MEEALPEVDDTHMGNDEVEWHRILVPTSIQLMECEWQWRDQGWGNRKGNLRGNCIWSFFEI